MPSIAKQKPPSHLDARLVTLIQKYEGAEDPTTIHANLDALEGTSRCVCCRLALDDEEAHAVMTAMLARKERVEDVAGYLVSRGHRVSVSMLSRHQKHHLFPGLLNVAITTGAMERIAKTGFGVVSGDLAEMTVRAMMVTILQVLNDPENAKSLAKLRKLRIEDPVAFGTYVSNMSKSLASIRKSNNQAQIMDAKLALERAKLYQEGQKLIDRGFVALREILEPSEEGRAILASLEAFIKAPNPTS